MNKVLCAYIKYFRYKDGSECNYTNNFIKQHQQVISRSGYGYINLAHYIEKKGETENRLDISTKEYYRYLVDSEDISELEELIAMSRDEILGIKVDSKKGEPNQKWHLLVSYLGMKWFQNGRIYIHMISCPELWIWMLESSGEFNDAELKRVYDMAVAYRHKNIDFMNWKSFLKEYRKKLHSKVMDSLSK